MRCTFTFPLVILLCTALKAQVYTGYTQVGADGGGSFHAECTEILMFDNYNDNIASGVAGQNFAIGLLSGDSLYLNLKRLPGGNQVYTTQAPPTLGSSFGQFGYSGLTGQCDFYEYNYGSFTLIFSNIVLKDASGNIVPNYTLMVFDGEGTGNGEQIACIAPVAHNWYNWDTVYPPSLICTPAQSGVGTNTTYITGDCNNTYYTSFGFAVDSPDSLTAEIIEGGTNGKEGVVLGIRRIIPSFTDTVCITGAVDINPLNAVAGTTYTWPAPVVSPPGSVTGATAQSAGISSITQNLVNTTNAAATVTYTITPVSCGLVANAFTATVVLLPAINAGPDQNICGSSTVMAASGTGTWSALPSNPAATTIANPASPTTAISGMTVSGNYNFAWNNGHGCADTVTINVGPTGSVTINSPDTLICPGGSAQICAPQGYTGYLWSNGDTTVCITTSLPGTYSLTATENGGCLATSNQINIQINPPGTVTISSADTFLCSGGIAQICAPSGYPVYAWSNGDTTACITTYLPGTYSLTVTQNSGCVATSNQIQIQNHQPGPITITSADTLICPGDSAQICAQQGYTAYAWSTGDTTTCITTPYAGNYYLTVTEGGGCSASSNEIKVKIRQPSPVTISVSGDTLFVYAAQSYQWYFNGHAITGATTQTLIADSSGTYTAIVTDSSGCTATSSPVVVTGITNVIGDLLSIYPNPSSGEWNLHVSQDLIEADIAIFDAAGRLILSDKIKTPDSILDPPLSSSGIYLLKLITGKGSILQKLVKF